MEEGPSRKLAVLVHADVVGSTALVQANETLAHQRIQDTFRRFSETIISHGGTAHEIRGDALVAEFSKVSDAVSAALAYQAASAVHNEELPDQVRPVIRVGIAMGEVVVADNTITGEGVVLSQRLEQLAEPGGVCIQGAAYETVPKRLPFDYESLGEQELKGFDEPVRAYAVTLKPGGKIPAPESTRAPAEAHPELPGKPSIAVLPFTNMSGDPEQEYFSDGITEDIITELARFRSLFVIARNSTFTYKGQAVNVSEVGENLGIHFVVEGSVRKAGNRVRVSAQLVDAKTGIHLWAERYDRELEDIFAVQDELVRTIVSTVGGRIDEAGKQRTTQMNEASLRAYDLYLRARAAQDRNTKEDYQQAQKYLEQAIEVDPGLAQVYHDLSLVKLVDWMAHWTDDREKTFADALKAAKRAVALDNTDSKIHSQLGLLHIYRREFDEARLHLERAIVLNPNDSDAFCLYGLYLTAIGDPDQGIKQFDSAAQLNPLAPRWSNWLRGIAYFTAGRYDDAISTLKLIENPINEVHGWLAASYGHVGRLEEARAMLERFLLIAEEDMAVFPGRTLEEWKTFWHGAIEYENQAHFDQLFDGLRKAGLQ